MFLLKKADKDSVTTRTFNRNKQILQKMLVSASVVRQKNFGCHYDSQNEVPQEKIKLGVGVMVMGQHVWHNIHLK